MKYLYQEPRGRRLLPGMLCSHPRCGVDPHAACPACGRVRAGLDALCTPEQALALYQEVERATADLLRTAQAVRQTGGIS